MIIVCGESRKRNAHGNPNLRIEKEAPEKKKQRGIEDSSPEAKNQTECTLFYYSYPFLPENNEAEKKKGRKETKTRENKIQYQQNVLSKTNVKKKRMRFSGVRNCFSKIFSRAFFLLLLLFG